MRQPLIRLGMILLTSYSEPNDVLRLSFYHKNDVLRLSFYHQLGHAQSQFTTPTNSRPVLLTNSFKQFQFSLHQVAHTGNYPQTKSACRYNAVTHFFLRALRFTQEHQSY
jgi:hypothetical protein